MYVQTLTSERNELQHRVEELESALDATVEYLRSRRGRQAQLPEMFPYPRNPRADNPIGSGLSPERAPNRRTWFVLASVIILLPLLLAASAYRRGTVPARVGTNGAAAAPTTVPFGFKSTPADIELHPDILRRTAATDPQPDGLIVSIATATECWIGVEIDGERRIERLLRHDEQFSVHARNDLLLRVGNAGAVSFSINGRAAKPLGTAGQPVTARITSANFEQFLTRVDPL